MLIYFKFDTLNFSIYLFQDNVMVRLQKLKKGTASVTSGLALRNRPAFIIPVGEHTQVLPYKSLKTLK